MSMQPTVIGGAATGVRESVLIAIPVQAANLPVVLSPTLSMSLDPQQMQAVNQLLSRVDFMSTTQRDIAVLSNEVEVALHKTLDGFLARINNLDNPKLFKLVKGLNEAVGKQNLPELADRILNSQPSFWEKASNIFSKKGMAKAMDDAWEETKRLVQGRTKTLVDLVNTMERELKTEQGKLDGEVRSMDQLKDAYAQRFNDFVIAVAFTGAFLERAKMQVAEAQTQMDPANPVHKRQFDELQDKLQALESRALALEGTLTRLPADQLVIRQLQNAGISTLQETWTTAAGRFASIKMTLLTINGAMIVKSVQQLANQGAELDSSLMQVRGKMMTDVVTTAANAPGDNRVAQAEQLRGIVADTAKLAEIVEQARLTNQQKFGQARQMFDQARQDMLALGQQIRP